MVTGLPRSSFPTSLSYTHMGLLDFLKDAGKDLFGGKPENAAQSIMDEIQRALGDNITGLGVRFDNGRVTLNGQAKSLAAKEQAALIAGNVRGVEHVNDDALTVVGSSAAAATAAAATAPASSRFYTVKSGDSLSKIAKEMYGDANAYARIHDANREVIGPDADKIYPGQQLRIPA